MLLVPVITGLVIHQIPEAAGWARSALALPLRPSRGTPALAIELFTNNVRVAVVPLAGAALLLAFSQPGRSIAVPRALLDVYLAAATIANATMLAGALVGYGPLRLATWLPHVPFEFAALALGLSAYGASRSRALTVRSLLGVATWVLAALIVAAALETWVTPQS
jgi:hypothetical protein